MALGLLWEFEYLANLVVDWERFTRRSLFGVALRQLLEVGPIEEGSKLGGVVLFQFLLKTRRLRLRSRQPSTLLLATIAVALGFTAEENLVYLTNNTASAFDRLIGTPGHALFSAPWGYALGVANCALFRASRYRGLIGRAWVNAVLCHALVNILSGAWRYSPPINFLSYGLFPFLLWMFWRLEGYLRRSRFQLPIILISGQTPTHRYWQRGLVLFALMLGGNSIFGFLLLARNLSPLPVFLLFLLNLIPALIAWGIYRYLRYAAERY